VRRLLGKFFHLPSEPKQALHSSSIMPVMSLQEVLQRASVGYLAQHIAKRLNLEKPDELFYQAFTRHSLSENQLQSTQHESLIVWANKLYVWMKSGEEVAAKIKEMQLPVEFEACLMKTYEELKEQFETVFPANSFSGSGKKANGKEALQESEMGERDNRKTWEIYRDVMYAVTQKKFLLITEEEIPQYTNGRILCEGAIKERADVPKCRNLAQQALLQVIAKPELVMGWLLVISEALTNILKHAEEGRMILVEDNGIIRVIVEDKGPGFLLKDLPKMTLMAGYSTKKSLGQGFTLMMKMSRQILLSTSSTGSTIILILNQEEGQ
jgi:anti-sigma regulatory factor (Ser/Thr protein kinase)